MKISTTLFLIALATILSCFLIPGCNSDNKKEKSPAKIREIQFSHLQRSKNQLYYNDAEKVPYTGKVVEFWDSTHKRLEFFCNNGMKDSTELQWFPNGKLKSKSTYKKGLPVDTITKWYDTGRKMVVACFKNGVITGKQTVWFDNGNKFRETTYADGEKNGVTTYWLKNGDTSATVEYLNNQENGARVVYNRYGMHTNTTYTTPLSPAINSKHYADIAVNPKIKHRIVLWDRIKYDNGLYYVIGEKLPYYGKIACLYKNKKVKWIENFINGIAQGDLMGWYPSGALKYTFSDVWGKSHGLATQWHENGKIEWEGVKTMNEFTGIVREYSADGKISSQYDMIQGVQYGTTISYYTNGKIKSVFEYINDEVLSENTWDETGKPIKSDIKKQ